MPIYTPLQSPGENFPQPDIGAVCPFSGNGAEMQRFMGCFLTEWFEPCENRLLSRAALNEGCLFRGSLIWIVSAVRRSALLPTENPPAIPLWILPPRYPARCLPRHWGSCRQPRQAPAGEQRAVYDFFFSCETAPFKTKKGPCIHQEKDRHRAPVIFIRSANAVIFVENAKKPRLADRSRSTNWGFKLCEY